MMPNIDLEGIRKIINQFDTLLTLFQIYLPNVDPDLIYDLLMRLRDNPGITPTYTLEVYTGKEVDLTRIIDFIYKITGAIAMVYDDNTHYVTNQKLSLVMLKKISDMDGVIEITGAHTTSGCWFSDAIKRRDI
jgi:hypothetical protein